MQPGLTLGEMMSLRLRNQDFPGDPADYVAERLARVRSGQAWSVVDDLPDGRAISVVGTPLADGGCVVTHEDITERRSIRR